MRADSVCLVRTGSRDRLLKANGACSASFAEHVFCYDSSKSGRCEAVERCGCKLPA
jgi:hypothetical protein